MKELISMLKEVTPGIWEALVYQQIIGGLFRLGVGVVFLFLFILCLYGVRTFKKEKREVESGTEKETEL